jgi:chromosome segregation and condensation protein ScpB
LSDDEKKVFNALTTSESHLTARQIREITGLETPDAVYKVVYTLRHRIAMSSLPLTIVGSKGKGGNGYILVWKKEK